LLRDLATAQPSKGAGFGYKGAANAILALDRPIESLLAPDGTLPRIPDVGPKSERVILDVLHTGGSSFVEQAVESSDKADEIRKQRGLRHNFLSRSRVVEALNEVSPEAPTADDYRGDLQMHSTWSDGVQTLDEIVQAGLALGYSYSAVTDHSYGLRIAGGMSMDDMRRQHDEIDRLNRRYAGSFRLIKGVEANIGADGSIDMTPSERAALELVLAAPHSSLRSSADQTARMITAVQAPHVHILAHPRGRMYGRRAGVQANWREVFDAAAASNVAIEIDGDPWRQDIDYELAAQALDAGCLFALDSDAHSPPELRNAETAIAHARLAGVPRERVINCWSAEQLMEWLGTKDGSTPSGR
jgi:histidinol phosphatase-like PHP family hydrolase